MRYINTGLQMFLDVNEYDQALFMFNAISFAEDEDIVKIQLTK